MTTSLSSRGTAAWISTKCLALRVQKCSLGKMTDFTGTYPLKYKQSSCSSSNSTSLLDRRYHIRTYVRSCQLYKKKDPFTLDTRRVQTWSGTSRRTGTCTTSIAATTGSWSSHFKTKRKLLIFKRNPTRVQTLATVNQVSTDPRPKQTSVSLLLESWNIDTILSKMNPAVRSWQCQDGAVPWKTRSKSFKDWMTTVRCCLSIKDLTRISGKSQNPHLLGWSSKLSGTTTKPPHYWTCTTRACISNNQDQCIGKPGILSTILFSCATRSFRLWRRKPQLTLIDVSCRSSVTTVWKRMTRWSCATKQQKTESTSMSVSNMFTMTNATTKRLTWRISTCPTI